MNVRFFTIQGGEDMLVDTLGMSLLFLPDLQYHFHGLDPNLIVNHAYNIALYLLINNNTKQRKQRIQSRPRIPNQQWSLITSRKHRVL